MGRWARGVIGGGHTETDSQLGGLGNESAPVNGRFDALRASDWVQACMIVCTQLYARSWLL